MNYDKNENNTKINTTNKTPLIKLTGLWQGKSQNGETYYSAKILPNVKILIMKNNFKKKDSEPDYTMYLSHVPPASPGTVEQKNDPDSPQDDMYNFDINSIDLTDIRL